MLIENMEKAVKLHTDLSQTNHRMDSLMVNTDSSVIQRNVSSSFLLEEDKIQIELFVYDFFAKALIKKREKITQEIKDLK